MSGADRYATNKAAADAFFADAPTFAGVASGESWSALPSPNRYAKPST